MGVQNLFVLENPHSDHRNLSINTNVYANNDEDCEEKEDLNRIGKLNIFKAIWVDVREEVRKLNLMDLFNKNTSLSIILSKFYELMADACERAKTPKKRNFKSKIPRKYKRLFKLRVIFLRKLKTVNGKPKNRIERQKVKNANKRLTEIDLALK